MTLSHTTVEPLNASPEALGAVAVLAADAPPLATQEEFFLWCLEVFFKSLISLLPTKYNVEKDREGREAGTQCVQLIQLCPKNLQNFHTSSVTKNGQEYKAVNQRMCASNCCILSA